MKTDVRILLVGVVLAASLGYSESPRADHPAVEFSHEHRVACKVCRLPYHSRSGEASRHGVNRRLDRETDNTASVSRAGSSNDELAHWRGEF